MSNEWKPFPPPVDTDVLVRDDDNNICVATFNEESLRDPVLVGWYWQELPLLPERKPERKIVGFMLNESEDRVIQPGEYRIVLNGIEQQAGTPSIYKWKPVTPIYADDPQPPSPEIADEIRRIVYKLRENQLALGGLSQEEWTSTVSVLAWLSGQPAPDGDNSYVSPPPKRIITRTELTPEQVEGLVYLCRSLASQGIHSVQNAFDTVRAIGTDKTLEHLLQEIKSETPSGANS